MKIKGKKVTKKEKKRIRKIHCTFCDKEVVLKENNECPECGIVYIVY